jgi:hypothetical protein
MPSVPKNQVQELYAELRVRLAQDPLFTGSGSLDTLDGLMAKLPDTVEELFGDTLQGDADAYRYAGVLLCGELVRRFAAHQVYTHDSGLTVDDEEVLFFGGDLKVGGDLVLGDQSIVVVAGDADIDGSFVGGATDYSLLGVAGAVTAGNVMTQGELLAGQRVTVQDVAYFYRNGYSAVAPALRARVLVENERFNTFSKVNADDQLAELLTLEHLPRASALLGVGGVESLEELEQSLRSRLTS